MTNLPQERGGRRSEAYLLRQIISADVDACVCGAFGFALGGFLTSVAPGEGRRLGDGSEFTDGDD